MLSVGIDLIEIHRIERSLQNDYFIKRVFGEHEIAELTGRSYPPESAAAAFAAKEAFSKSIGTGVKGFSLTEVELLHDENGAPYLLLSGKAKQIANEKRFGFSVSISHTRELATAIVIAFHKGA